MEKRNWILLFALASGASSYTSSAQVNCPIFHEEPKCGKHELGVNLFSWINLDFDHATDRSGDMSYANGLLYRFHCGQNVFRAGVDVFRYEYEEGTRPESVEGLYPWYSYAEGRSTTAEARLGYERRLSKGKLQPYVGGEIAFRYVKKDGRYEGLGDFGPPYEFSGETHTRSEQFMFSPLFGLTYRFAEHFSVSLEASYAFGTQRTTDEVRGQVGTRQKLGFANPIRTMSVNYHF